MSVPCNFLASRIMRASKNGMEEHKELDHLEDCIDFYGRCRPDRNEVNRLKKLHTQITQKTRDPSYHKDFHRVKRNAYNKTVYFGTENIMLFTHFIVF